MSGKKSILRKLKIYMISFGIFMGFVFPAYADFFVIWKKGTFIYFFIGCIFAGITVGVVSYIFVKVILIKQLNKISVQAEAIRKKDISHQIFINSNDNIGLIISGFNSAVLSIRKLFTEIEKIYDLAKISLSRVEYNHTDSGEEISSVDAIQMAISEVNSKSQRVVNLSEQILDLVNTGKKLVGHTVKSFDESSHGITNFSNIMKSLVAKSERITEITTIIDRISSKTEMLALNASMEAKRAGQYGESFIVVANEIKKLALSSSESVKNISEYIKLIQNDIREADKAIVIVTGGVRKNSKDIRYTIDNFDKIEESTSENLEMNKQMTDSVNNLNHSFVSIEKVLKELTDNINHLKSIIDSYKR